MSDYKIGSVVFNPAPHAAAPMCPAPGSMQTLTIGGPVTIESRDIELARLRSEIALRDRCIVWCLENGAKWMPKWNAFCQPVSDSLFKSLEVPADLAAIISKSGGVRG